ncbi:MAG: hypothetical protein ACOYBD_08670 [Bilifractor sp.]|jgi:hypothetical protein
MTEASRQVLDTVRESFAGNWFLLLWIISLIYLFFAEKEKRRIFVYPSILLGVLIFNPILYRYVWDKLFDYAYWRAFWMVPVLPAIAAAAVSLAGRMRRKSVKAGVIAAVLALSAVTGTFIYKDRFVRAQNRCKLPQASIDVADALLALDSEPRATVDASLFCYIRQYSPDIHLMYGRDAWGYIDIIGNGSYSVYQQMILPQPDLSYVRSCMLDWKYDYLVMLPSQAPGYRQEDAESYDSSFYSDALGSAGFEYLENVDGYLICKAIPDGAETE